MTYRIRAHHGMCFSYFQGKGYNGEFTENMWKMKRKLEENPEVILLCGADDVCARCPNHHDGICAENAAAPADADNGLSLPSGNTPQPSCPGPKPRPGKAERYDRQVLACCGLTEGTKIRWKDFAETVSARILTPGNREKICGDCEWNDLCR